MHFTGRTWRPPYEAHSVIIQATWSAICGHYTEMSVYVIDRTLSAFVPIDMIYP